MANRSPGARLGGCRCAAATCQPTHHTCHRIQEHFRRVRRQLAAAGGSDAQGFIRSQPDLQAELDDKEQELCGQLYRRAAVEIRRHFAHEDRVTSSGGRYQGLGAAGVTDPLKDDQDRSASARRGSPIGPR
jgi:hypothetical protein